MKSIFIVAALLVATAAGQSLDILNRFNNQQDASLDYYNRPLYDRVYRRLLGHPLERSFIYGESLQVPAYLQDDIFDVNILQLDDIVAHPLFRVYIGLPYFRQYWSYPMFQRYVCSTYFQRFFEIPSFQQYFINPVLFYKYIYPLVTLFKFGNTPYGYPYSTTPSQYPGYPYSTQYPGYPYSSQNTGYPYSTQYPGYPYSTQYPGYPYSTQYPGYPYSAQYPGYPYYYPTQYQKQAPINLEVYYKNLLEEMMSHLYSSKDASPAGQLQEVAPKVDLEKVQEETIGKVVEPVTEDVHVTTGDAKRVEETTIPVETVPEQHISTTQIPTTSAIPEQEPGRLNRFYPARYYDPRHLPRA